MTIVLQKRDAGQMRCPSILIAALLWLTGTPAYALQVGDERVVNSGEFLQQTDEAIKSGRFVQAGQMLVWLEQQADPSFQDDVALLRAEYAISTGNDADAAGAVAKISDKSRNGCRQNAVRGWVAGKQNDLNRSILLLARASGMCPEDVGIWNLLGLAFINKGEASAGIDALEQAMALSPNVPGLMNNYALALVQAGDYEAALRYLDNALILETRNPLIVRNRDFVLGMTGQMPQRKTGEGDAVWAQRLINSGNGANSLQRDSVATATFAQAILLLDHFDEKAWAIANGAQGHSNK
jgi:Flp pilus assembly protein TadD